VNWRELLEADAAEVGRDVQARQLAMTLHRPGITADRGHVVEPPIEELAEGERGRVDILAMLLPGEQLDPGRLGRLLGVYPLCHLRIRLSSGPRPMSMTTE
jgi:hypothetical protein